MTDPLHPDVPPQFETERLLIRCPQPGDGAALYDAIVASKDHLAAWLTWANWPNISLKRAEASILRNRDRYLKGEDMTMLIFLKGTGELVGGSGLHNPDWQVPKFEIGYWQHVDFGGQGYMTEAVKAIAELAFSHLGAKRLHLECYPHNERSISVAQRCGFQLEARLANYRRHHQTGELHDWLIFARFPP
ncbi:MAG: GNAT family N-acetyltransferase [Anaerolineaceae bacterium]|nr:GNAT family N-acetyltransferase [Anaerolineaceae bacterium]